MQEKSIGQLYQKIFGKEVPSRRDNSVLKNDVYSGLATHAIWQRLVTFIFFIFQNGGLPKDRVVFV